MNDDFSLITDKGLPILVASLVFVIIKYLRSPIGQLMAKAIDPKLLMSSWPDWTRSLTIGLSVGSASFLTSMSQGDSLSHSAIMAVSGLLAMLNFDTPKIQQNASISVPLPKPMIDRPAQDPGIPKLMILLPLTLLFFTSCAHYRARALAQSPIMTPHMLAAPQAIIAITDAQCVSWLKSEAIYGAIAAGLGVVTGGGGLASAFPPDQSNRALVGGISLGVGLLSATAVFLAKSDAENLQQFCAITKQP